MPTTLFGLNLYKGEGKEVKKKERSRGERGVGVGKDLTCIYFNLCSQPTCMLHIQSYFQNPSETNPSLPLNFKRKTKNLKYLVIWILQMSPHSGLSQKCSGPLPLQLHCEWTILMTALTMMSSTRYASFLTLSDLPAPL